jgi:hypothetical protein
VAHVVFRRMCSVGALLATIALAHVCQGKPLTPYSPYIGIALKRYVLMNTTIQVPRQHTLEGGPPGRM